MSDSANAAWAHQFLQQADDAGPNELQVANVLSNMGIGFALLAIADAINNHAEAIANQQPGNNGRN